MAKDLQLSLFTCTQRKSGKPIFRLWPKTLERRSRLLSPSHCLPETNLKEKRLSSQLRRSLPFPSRPKTRRAQKANQPRLLSTSCNSWHSMSRAVWQLEATFANSQSCRKRAIASPNLCSPMTNNAPLPALFSLELSACSSFDASLPSFNSGIDVGVEGLAVWHQGRLLLHQKDEKLAMRPGAEPQPTQLPEDTWFLLQKEEEELAIRPYFPGTFHCSEVVRWRTLSQASRKGHRTSPHKGSINYDATRSLVIAALLPHSLEPISVLTHFDALSSTALGSLRCSSHNSNRAVRLVQPCFGNLISRQGRHCAPKGGHVQPFLLI